MFDKFQQGQEATEAASNDKDQLSRRNSNKDFQCGLRRALFNNSATKIAAILPEKPEEIRLRLEQVHLGSEGVQ